MSDRAHNETRERLHRPAMQQHALGQFYMFSSSDLEGWESDEKFQFKVLYTLNLL
jgi:hypothetical protein